MSSESHSRSRSRSPLRQDDSEADDKSENAENRVDVSNIPADCSWKEIKDLFIEKVGQVFFISLKEDKAERTKSCCIEFSDLEMAQKAVSIMQKCDIRGRALKVKLNSDRSDSQVPTNDDSGTEDSIVDVTPSSEPAGPSHLNNTYVLSPEFLKSLSIDGPLSNKVLISNLDESVTEEKLKEVFEIPGKLLKVELCVDSSGKSLGHGSAEYRQPLESVQAISMLNGQELHNSPINVKMDKPVVKLDSIPKLPSGLSGIGKGIGINGQLLQFNDVLAGINSEVGQPLNISVDLSVIGSSFGVNVKPVQINVDLSNVNNSPENIDEPIQINATANGNLEPEMKGAKKGDSEQIPECAVCLEACFLPVRLPCNHIFCYLCVKGIVHQSQRCSLCRQPIPLNYLNNPILMNPLQAFVSEKGQYKWFYEGHNGWWQYDDRSCSEIEKAFNEGKDRCELMIAGVMYVIDLRLNVQMRRDNPNSSRSIKRDLASIPKKGIAGVVFHSSSNNPPASPNKK